MIKNILKALGIKKKRIPKNYFNTITIHKDNKNKKDMAYWVEFRFDGLLVRQDLIETLNFANGDGIQIKLQKHEVRLIK